MARQAIVIAWALASALAFPSSSDRKIVYGQDDRKDVCETADDMWKDIARNSILAIMDIGTLGTPQNGIYNAPKIYASLTSRRNLCPEQRFRFQPTAAVCSATLIAPDRVLTAGHCISTTSCSRRAFVFNYFLDGASCTMPDITADDVYRCTHLERVETSSLDFAVVHLDRPVVGPNRFPVPMQTSAVPLTIGDPIIVLGYGSGLPLKVDVGGNVIDPRSGAMDYFVASTDTFGGNSGSGAFDASGTLVGILVRGQTDYIMSGSCRVVNVVGCTDETCSKLSDAEELTYSHRAAAVPDCRSNNECPVGKTCLRNCPVDSSACTGWCVV